MFRLGDVKNWIGCQSDRAKVNPGGSVSKSADAAMRGLTRHFRAAFALKCSVCPRIAPKDQSGRQRVLATTLDSEEFGRTQTPLRLFTCPGFQHSASRPRAPNVPPRRAPRSS